jgi:hypothetical protein
MMRKYALVVTLFLILMNSLTGIIGRIARYALGIDQTEAEIDNARRRFGTENLVFPFTSVLYYFSRFSHVA